MLIYITEYVDFEEDLSKIRSNLTIPHTLLIKEINGYKKKAIIRYIPDSEIKNTFIINKEEVKRLLKDSREISLMLNSLPVKHRERKLSELKEGTRYNIFKLR